MNVHSYVFRSISGANMPLQRWAGQPLLIVNTASECGYTPQYQKLQNLWNEYMPSGLVVVGIPCNDFGEQEPGSDEEIAAFCSTQYRVSFPMTTKQTIIGRGAHPLFIDLREEYTRDILPRWNFCKYLFSRDGALVDHWPSKVEPDDLLFKREIERNMASWNL